MTAEIPITKKTDEKTNDIYIIENKKRSEFIDLQKKSEDGTR